MDNITKTSNSQLVEKFKKILNILTEIANTSDREALNLDIELLYAFVLKIIKQLTIREGEPNEKIRN